MKCPNCGAGKVYYPTPKDAWHMAMVKQRVLRDDAVDHILWAMERPAAAYRDIQRGFIDPEFREAIEFGIWLGLKRRGYGFDGRMFGEKRRQDDGPGI